MSKWFINFRQGHIQQLWDRGASLARKDLCEAFSISHQQASADIKLYLEKHPGSWRYDASAKRYEVVKPHELEEINGRLA